MGKDVIIALDFKDGETALRFLDTFGEERPFVKIGLELFYAEGPRIVRRIKERGHKIFLDLKLHDIPNTAKGGMRSLSALGADIVNVHAAGTIEMMRAALEGAVRPDGTRPLVIAVTFLTSTSEFVLQKELLINSDMDGAIARYARNAKEAGLDGVVCSPLEAGMVKKLLGQDFLTVTPGVRFTGDRAGDQVRVTTPRMAKELGSDYIVVGRPITRSPDPLSAYKRCVREFVD